MSQMENNGERFGERFKIAIFGGSHSPSLGVLIQGIPIEYRIDKEELQKEINRRKPTNKWTTPRKEDDIPTIIQYDDLLVISFENKNINDSDYDKFKDTPRPSHADYVQLNRGKDILGGGMASGRMTLPIVAAGFVAKDLLKKYYAKDIQFESYVDAIKGEKLKEAQEQVLDYCLEHGDSVGAAIRCVVTNPPKFIGDPFFNSVESMISHLAFSIPGVKAIEFGDGERCAHLLGSQRNDVYIDAEGHTATNSEGGINGGITNGNPITFKVSVKPTPSIKMKQHTFNFKTGQMEDLEIGGRHDICFALRLPVVMESIAAIALINLC